MSLLTLSSAALAGEPATALRETLSEGCPAERAHCVGLVLHVAPSADDDDALVASGEWVARQIEVANHHFAPADVGFEMVRVETLDADERVIESRTDRDVLGRARFARGEVHVFIVGRLDNVDDEGQIYGVHWRDRDDRSHRWVIVSAIAHDTTLAHELGHFFGLKHSDYAVSIMNKTRRDDPPYEERTFHEDEVDTIVKRRKKMLKNGMLTDRADAESPESR